MCRGKSEFRPTCTLLLTRFRGDDWSRSSVATAWESTHTFFGLAHRHGILPSWSSHCSPRGARSFCPALGWVARYAEACSARGIFSFFNCATIKDQGSTIRFSFICETIISKTVWERKQYVYSFVVDVSFSFQWLLSSCLLWMKISEIDHFKKLLIMKICIHIYFNIINEKQKEGTCSQLA